MQKTVTNSECQGKQAADCQHSMSCILNPMSFVSTHEIICLRYIIGHKIACSHASKDFPSKHEGADLFKTVIMVILVKFYCTGHS